MAKKLGYSTQVKTYFATKWALTQGIFSFQGELTPTGYASEVRATGAGHFLKVGKDCFETLAEAQEDQLERARRNVEAIARKLAKARAKLAELEAKNG